jgi:hypothetical protein
MALGAYLLRQWLAPLPDQQLKWLEMGSLEKKKFMAMTPEEREE